MKEVMYACVRCQTRWESSLRQPAVKETCDGCGAYLHCCKNCRFHRHGYPNECYIPDTEKIANKSGANFCDEFEFAAVKPAEAKAGASGAVAGLWEEAEDDMAPKAGAESAVKEWLAESETPKQGFDDLFGG